MFFSSRFTVLRILLENLGLKLLPEVFSSFRAGETAQVRNRLSCKLENLHWIPRISILFVLLCLVLSLAWCTCNHRTRETGTGPRRASPLLQAAGQQEFLSQKHVGMLIHKQCTHHVGTQKRETRRSLYPESIPPPRRT